MGEGLEDAYCGTSGGGSGGKNSISTQHLIHLHRRETGATDGCLEERLKITLTFWSSPLGSAVVSDIRGLRWNGSKSHRRIHVSHEVICTRNRDGSMSKWLKISITCLYSEMAHFFIIKTEMAQNLPTIKRHVIEILSHFEIESYGILMHMTSRETCIPMTFWANSPYPRTLSIDSIGHTQLQASI